MRTCRNGDLGVKPSEVRTVPFQDRRATHSRTLQACASPAGIRRVSRPIHLTRRDTTLDRKACNSSRVRNAVLAMSKLHRRIRDVHPGTAPCVLCASGFRTRSRGFGRSSSPPAKPCPSRVKRPASTPGSDPIRLGHRVQTAIVHAVTPLQIFDFKCPVRHHSFTNAGVVQMVELEGGSAIDPRRRCTLNVDRRRVRSTGLTRPVQSKPGRDQPGCRTGSLADCGPRLTTADVRRRSHRFEEQIELWLHPERNNQFQSLGDNRIGDNALPSTKPEAAGTQGATESSPRALQPWQRSYTVWTGKPSRETSHEEGLIGKPSDRHVLLHDLRQARCSAASSRASLLARPELRERLAPSPR